MLRETTKRRDADELKRALGVKDPNPDYVPPPLVDIQDQLRTGRRPMTSELNRDLEQEVAQDLVEEIKASFEETIIRGKPGATAEDTEAAMKETVRMIKVEWAKERNRPVPIEMVLEREAKSREESLALIKAEMFGTTSTEDYSSG